MKTMAFVVCAVLFSLACFATISVQANPFLDELMQFAPSDNYMFRNYLTSAALQDDNNRANSGNSVQSPVVPSQFDDGLQNNDSGDYVLDAEKYNRPSPVRPQQPGTDAPSPTTFQQQQQQQQEDVDRVPLQRTDSGDVYTIKNELSEDHRDGLLAMLEEEERARANEPTPSTRNIIEEILYSREMTQKPKCNCKGREGEGVREEEEETAGDNIKFEDDRNQVKQQDAIFQIKESLKKETDERKRFMTKMEQRLARIEGEKMNSLVNSAQQIVGSEEQSSESSDTS